MRVLLKIAYVIAAFLVLSCGSTRRSINSDFSFLYKKETFVLHPNCVVHHTTEESSDLYFSINSKELLYAKQLNETEYRAHIELNYLVVLSSDTRVTVDSGDVHITDVNNDNTQKLITGSVKLKLPTKKTYTVSLIFTDLNKKTSAELLLDVDKTSNTAPLNYLVKMKDGTAPLFRNYLQPDEEALITHSHPAERLFGKYYKKDFGLAAPPFSVMDVRPLGFRPDSTFVVTTDNNGNFPVKFNSEGVYFLQTDTNAKDGLTLYRYYNGFPEIARADQMITPLRYLTSKQEYDEMAAAKNKKLSVENFWITSTGNQDRAREVIKKFYNRVTDANRYFSSYLEGWKTDRGMIYVIYGPPGQVYKNNGFEMWTYGDSNNPNALHFNFNRVENQFSENDYSLERSPIFKASWYRAVDIWRQGRIYLQN